MELWIRSQDKKHLIKVNNIELNKTAIITREKDVVLLGIYSEKRTLKVLEEIQNIIKPKAILQAKSMLSREAMKQIQEDYDMTVLPSCVDAIQPISTPIVYEMPEE